MTKKDADDANDVNVNVGCCRIDDKKDQDEACFKFLIKLCY